MSLDGRLCGAFYAVGRRSREVFHSVKSTTTSAPRNNSSSICSVPRATRRLARQTQMYAADQPLWRRYEQACDFLEDDLESGFVRVLQEMIAAGWSDPAIGERVRHLLQGWLDLITEVAREAESRLGPLGPFSADEISALVGQAFLGGEAMLLLGFERGQWPIRSALRRIGLLIRTFEDENQ